MDATWYRTGERQMPQVAGLPDDASPAGRGVTVEIGQTRRPVCATRSKRRTGRR